MIKIVGLVILDIFVDIRTLIIDMWCRLIGRLLLIVLNMLPLNKHMLMMGELSKEGQEISHAHNKIKGKFIGFT